MDTRFTRVVALGGALVTVLMLGACNQKSSPTEAADLSVTDTNRKEFLVKGVLKEIKPNGKTAIIAHEEIPDPKSEDGIYMVAMTMPLDVKDPKELQGLKAGDDISFRMVVTHDDGWIENVRKLDGTNSVTVLTNAGPMTFRKSPIVEPLEIGEQVPDYKFTNQFGQPISLHQFHGQALAVTFIFTRCPFPTFCPKMSSNMQQAYKRLASLPDAPTNWFLLSVSFDPEFDTPQRLHAYAAGYNANSNRWQFATSDFWNIDGITEQLGLQFWKDQGSINHNLRTAVIDRRGRLHKVFNGNEWSTDEFADEIARAARVE